MKLRKCRTKKNKVKKIGKKKLERLMRSCIRRESKRKRKCSCWGKSRRNLGSVSWESESWEKCLEKINLSKVVKRPRIWTCLNSGTKEIFAISKSDWHQVFFIDEVFNLFFFSFLSILYAVRLWSNWTSSKLNIWINIIWQTKYNI